jgi:hypothetical protein
VVRRRTPEGCLFRARGCRREAVSIAVAMSSPVTCGGQLGTLCHGRFDEPALDAMADRVVQVISLVQDHRHGFEAAPPGLRTPITPPRGSLFHAETQLMIEAETALRLAAVPVETLACAGTDHLIDQAAWCAEAFSCIRCSACPRADCSYPSGAAVRIEGCGGGTRI